MGMIMSAYGPVKPLGELYSRLDSAILSAGATPAETPTSYRMYSDTEVAQAVYELRSGGQIGAVILRVFKGPTSNSIRPCATVTFAGSEELCSEQSGLVNQINGILKEHSSDVRTGKPDGISAKLKTEVLLSGLGR